MKAQLVILVFIIAAAVWCNEDEEDQEDGWSNRIEEMLLCMTQENVSEGKF